jgi:hypothetical protein
MRFTKAQAVCVWFWFDLLYIPALIVSIQRAWFRQLPVRAQEFLEVGLRGGLRPNGYCLEVQLVPTKADGYVQLSYGGANKFCTLGDMLGWARGIEATGLNQISHRCHNPLCAVPAHIVIETPAENNNRKGCLVWVNCYHCHLRMLVCPHTPTCIKYVPGWESWEDFIEGGIH